MSGHGWVTPNAGGGVARCGGPPMCAECCRELVVKHGQDTLPAATPRTRTDLLTTTEMFHLDQACRVISAAFGGQCPYLVGTAGVGGAESYRDVDVRLMLGNDEFAAACPTRERWELLCLSVSAYLASRTGLPIDFQVQRKPEALDRFGGKPRNPLGLLGNTGGRMFAGGGDATPEWGTG
jgi:hypothetical protein